MVSLYSFSALKNCYDNRTIISEPVSECQCELEMQIYTIILFPSHLSLQLADRRSEIEHQSCDVLQLALQHLDGIRLLLVLKKQQ